MMRFLAPNAITSLAIVCATWSIERALAGQTVAAAWLIVWCTLLDKLDGSVARLLGAGSLFGEQLDSLADLIAFGVAPAALVLAYCKSRPEVQSLWLRPTLQVAAAGYVLACCLRLARFNVTTLPPGAPRMFVGFPSTAVGGWIATLHLTMVAHGQQVRRAAADLVQAAPTLGLQSVSAAHVLLLALTVGAALMVSRLRVPKLSRLPSVPANVLMAVAVAVAAAAAALRVWPAYLFVLATTSMVASVIYHVSSTAARAVRVPRLFSEERSPS